MKRFVYAWAAFLAISFAACSGSGKNGSVTDSTDSLVGEKAVAVAPVIETGEGYNITDKGIVPVTGRPMIVNFSADWCTPCQELKPIFSNLKTEYENHIDFVTVNTDSKPDLPKIYGIRNIPTLLFLTKDGSIKKQTTGFIPADSIRRIISKEFNL